MNTKVTALALQGGAALGAYEYGVIKALYEQPNFKLDIITGISIGAFNAAVLAGTRADPLEVLDTLWRKHFAISDPPLIPQAIKQYLSLLGNQGMYWLRPSYLFVPLLAPFWTTSLYDSSPLHHTLSALIDLDWLNDDKNPIHVALAAVNVGTGNLEYFENKGDKKLSIDEIVASGSIAPALPMTKVQDPYAEKAKWFWDGAFHSNLPLSQAINLLETTKGGNPNVQRELIVVELFPMPSELPSNMLEVFDRMLELVFSSKLELDRKFFKKINSYIELFEKVDKEIPQESAIRKDVAYKELMSHKKIDSFTVITAKDGESLVGPADFSKTSIERRIQAGYRDAQAKLEC